MTIGIVGLGLIGGSLAASLKAKDHVILGSDSNKTIQDFARMAGRLDGILDEVNISKCDFIFIAIPQNRAIEWLSDNEDRIKDSAIVIDCCGIKRKICEVGFDIARAKNFTFVGGHPMAGKQIGGYKNSSADLFENAMFAIVPEDASDIRLMMDVRGILKDAGFTEFAVMTPEEHDQVIAFTSQMAHLISNAYIKSDMAEVGVGTYLSGGAFRDMTRVAYLDEDMWTELFLENKDNLLSELSGFIGELERYKDAIEGDDREALSSLLAEGKARKVEIENQ